MRSLVIVLTALAVCNGQLGLTANRLPYIGPPIAAPTVPRPIDGMGNNQAQPMWGTPNRDLVRGTDVTEYGPAPNDFETPRGGFPTSTLPNPRIISNTVHSIAPALGNFVPSVDFLSGLFPFFGQFLDHDLGLTGEEMPLVDISVLAPPGDAFFDPLSFGNGSITVDRFVFNNPGAMNDPRQHPNEITGWIDANNIYGSDVSRSDALRGRLNSVAAPLGGLLATCADLTTINGDRCGGSMDGAANYLPNNQLGAGDTAIANAPPNAPNAADLFVSGDVRTNENFALGIHHTLWFREHNRLAAEIAGVTTGLTDDQLFEEARRWLIAIMQHVVYDEFLSVLLGAAWPPFSYSPLALPNGGGTNVEVGAWTEGTSACFRLGHSMITDIVTRRTSTNTTITNVPDLRLAEAFFIDPLSATITPGITPTVAGLSLQISEQIDRFIVDSLRNFLFGTPDNFQGTVNFNELGGGGLDLVTINIQRGREVGLPNYNSVRNALGLTTVASFAAGPFDATTQSALEAAYGAGNVADCDLFTCAMSETRLANAQVGETLFAVLRAMYGNLRTGDRFFWENTASDGQGLTTDQRTRIERTSYRDVLVRNTVLGDADMQCLAMGHRDGCAGEAATTNTGTPPSDEEDTFIVRHAAKDAGDPIFGMGHDIGYRIDLSDDDQDDLFVEGTEGRSTSRNLRVERGTTYSFYCANSCASRFYLYTPGTDFTNTPLDGRWYPEAGSNVQVAPTGADQGCAGRVFTWTPDSNTPDTVYYGNRFFRFYGGQIEVVDGDAANAVVASLLAVLAALAVFFL